MCVSNDLEQTILARKTYLAIVGGLLSIFQMVMTFAIIGCELGNSFVQFERMNAFVGYWAFPFFMCAWISLAGASCCCRIRCCRITALVFQCLAIPFAVCVIGFDGYFLNNPTKCFFSSCSYDWYSNYEDQYSTDSLYSTKIPLIKGQLAAGVLILVSCIIYIVVFAWTSYREKTLSSAGINSHGPVIIHSRAPLHMNPIHEVAPPAEPSTLPNASWNQLSCHRCGCQFQVAIQYQ